MRNRVGILSETYSYATFRDRVTAVTRFVEEALNYARTNAPAIRSTTEQADARPLIGQRISLRSRTKRSERMVEILMGETAEDVNPYTGRTILRRLDVRKPERMWEFATFETTESERAPSAYYLPADLRPAVELLRAHGVRLEPLAQAASLPLEEFQIESNQTTAQAFENHRERTVTGTYAPVDRTLPAGTWRVPMNQPLARLAFYLLEARSNDGLLTWNVLDGALKDSKTSPVLRARN
jgi:hypothetical protein